MDSSVKLHSSLMELLPAFFFFYIVLAHQVLFTFFISLYH